MNIFSILFVILGLVVGYSGAMELPNTSVPIEYAGSSAFDLEQLSISAAQWKAFEGVEPVAADPEADRVHFEPVGSETISGIAFSDNGLKRVVWLADQDKFCINDPGDELDGGASFSGPEVILQESDDLIDIHWVDHRLALVSSEAITLFDPQTSAMQVHAFDVGYRLAANTPGYQPASFLVRNANELVFCTYSESQRFGQSYLNRIMFHSNGNMTTLAKIPMKRLLFYSLCAASEKFTAVIKNARPLDDDSTRNPKIKIFTTAQLDRLSEEDHGLKKVVPAITHTLPRMPIDAVIFSPDEKLLFVACIIKGVPSIIAGLIGASDISFVQRYTAPAQVWNMFWPAQAEGPYISHHHDGGSSSQLILSSAKSSGKRKTNGSKQTGKLQKLEQ